jgi:hypothetical protein
MKILEMRGATTGVVTAPETATVGQACRLLRNANVTALALLGPEGVCVFVGSWGQHIWCLWGSGVGCMGKELHSPPASTLLNCTLFSGRLHGNFSSSDVTSALYDADVFDKVCYHVFFCVLHYDAAPSSSRPVCRPFSLYCAYAPFCLHSIRFLSLYRPAGPASTVHRRSFPLPLCTHLTAFGIEVAYSFSYVLPDPPRIPGRKEPRLAFPCSRAGRHFPQ